MNRVVFAGVWALALLCSLCAAPAQAGNWINEVRVGAYQHDTGIVGTHKEGGADIAFEVLTAPVTALKFILSPRIQFGAAVNTAGKTSFVYLAIDKQYDFARSVFSSNDAFFIEGTIGGAWQSGKIDVRGTPDEANWKSHGSRFDFRPGFALGYRFDDHWSIQGNFNHYSNAGLGAPNEGLNDIGVLIGYRL